MRVTTDTTRWLRDTLPDVAWPAFNDPASVDSGLNGRANRIRGEPMVLFMGGALVFKAGLPEWSG